MVDYLAKTLVKIMSILFYFRLVLTSGSPGTVQQTIATKDNGSTFYQTTFTKVYPGTEYNVSIVAVREGTDSSKSSNETSTNVYTSQYFVN